MTLDSAPVGPDRIRIDPYPERDPGDADELQQKVDQVAGGAARAAVLGVNDGLVTTLALVLGLAAAGASTEAIRLAGVASLIAGAFSMAAGEWISVRAQVELFEGVLRELRALVARNPKLVLDTLGDRLEQSGMDTTTAKKASTEVAIDEDLFLSFTARNVFGVNDEELGSPMIAALSSLALFVVGALVPLLPWFLTNGAAAVVATIVLTSVSAVIVGGYIGRGAGTPPWRSASRQLAIVALASGVTYAIGLLLGTTIA